MRGGACSNSLRSISSSNRATRNGSPNLNSSAFDVRPREPVTVLNAAGGGALVLTCEHASCAVPAEYNNLGLHVDSLMEHIGWDVGAQEVTEALAAHFNATAVCSGVSRLVIDCNRDLPDHDLIVATSHGVSIPGNALLSVEERARRIRDFYDPYHASVDAIVAQRPEAMLLSVHSFTPVLNGRERPFDVGVLFDDYADEARALGAVLAEAGLRVRFNEPYSGLDGLIFSARKHGMRHGVRYLELELNNSRLRERSQIAMVAGTVARAWSQCFGV